MIKKDIVSTNFNAKYKTYLHTYSYINYRDQNEKNNFKQFLYQTTFTVTT